MDPTLHAAVLPPPPLGSIVDAIRFAAWIGLSSVLALVAFVMFPLVCFEVGRAASPYVSSNHIALALLAASVVLASRRTCCCGHMRR